MSGFVPGAQSVPGTSSAATFAGPTGAVSGRGMTFMDGGTCSKVVRDLPLLANFIGNVRGVLTSVQAQTKSNGAAVRSLLKTQANFNDNTHMLNYWMHQVSPHLDQTNVELTQANDALQGMRLSANSSEGERPGPPTGITVLPALAGNFIAFWLPPDYTGSSKIASYEIRMFATESAATANADSIVSGNVLSGVADASVYPTAALKAANGTGYAHELYAMYGDDLRFKALPGITSSPLSIRMRCNNTTDATLWSDWTLPTRLCARGALSDKAPMVTSVLCGTRDALVSWRAPSVQQADHSWTPFGDITGYRITGIADVAVPGGTTTVAQITAAQCPTPATGIQVAASVDAGATDQSTEAVSIKFHSFKKPLVVAPPRIMVHLENDTSDPLPANWKTVAYINCAMADFYDEWPIIYTVKVFDMSALSGTYDPTTGQVAQAVCYSSRFNEAHPIADAPSRCVMGHASLIPSTVNAAYVNTLFIGGHEYSFTATAALSNDQIASNPGNLPVSSAGAAAPVVGGTAVQSYYCPLVGPYLIPGSRLTSADTAAPPP